MKYTSTIWIRVEQVTCEPTAPSEAKTIKEEAAHMAHSRQNINTLRPGEDGRHFSVRHFQIQIRQ